MKSLPLVLLIILLFSCQKGDQTFNHTFIPQKKDQRELVVQYDTLDIEISGTSYVGNFKIFNTSLYFLDEIYCQIFELDLNGNLKGQFLEKGTGYNQIPKLQNMVKTEDFYILTHGWRFYLYDHSWNFKDQYVIDWGTLASNDDILNHPNPDETGMYEVDYVNNRLFVNEKSGEIFFKIITEHPIFNAFVSKEFYKSARILARMNIQNGKVTEIFGRYSPAYTNYSFIPYHVYSSYSFANNKFYLSYPPDPKIYVFDESFKPLLSFGEADNGISGKYEQTNYLSAFEDYELEERTNLEGIYSSIWAVDNSNYIFRKIRSDSGKYFLQIFDSSQFLGKIAIPSDFEFIGDYNGILYACLEINENAEKIKIIKIRVE